eukprot:7111339-Pyramimonas_sp.AAC.1
MHRIRYTPQYVYGTCWPLRYRPKVYFRLICATSEKGHADRQISQMTRHFMKQIARMLHCTLLAHG